MSTFPSKPSAARVALGLGAIYLIWGSTYLAMRVAVQTIPPFAMAGARFFVAGLILFTFVIARGAAWPTRRQWRDNWIAGTALLVGGNGLTAWAELTVPSGITALVISVQPVFMVVTEWAWRKSPRPNFAIWFGMALGFCGVAWLAQTEGPTPAERLNPAGLVAILFACAFWAFGSIYSRNAKQAAPPFVASALQMLCGSLMLGVTAVARGEIAQIHLATISRESWIGFVYLITAGSLVGFSTFVWLMKHSTPARVSTYAYVNPIVAILLGRLILHEPISPHIEVAALWIIAAVIIVTAQKSRLAKPNPTIFAPKQKEAA